MTDPLVSIIIPTYNTEKYICEAIDSALAQTYPNIEIIVVDDGSTDNTIDLLLNQYSDLKPDTPFKILHKGNGGTASALNLGIETAKGEWIHWLSADDKLMPGGVEKMMIHINSMTQHDRENSLFYSHYYHINENGEKIGEFVEKYRNNMSVEQQSQDLLVGYLAFANGTTSMIHKSIFTRFGMYNEKIPYFEDYEMWLRLSILHGIKFILVPEFTAMYRIHGGQLSKKVDISWNQKIIADIMKQK